MDILDAFLPFKCAGGRLEGNDLKSATLKASPVTALLWRRRLPIAWVFMRWEAYGLGRWYEGDCRRDL